MPDEQERDYLEEKLTAVLDVAMRELRRVLIDTLGEKISEHYSYSDCDAIAMEVSTSLQKDLRLNYEFNQALAQSDLYAAKGRINMDAVIDALKKQEQRVENAGHKAKLTHMIQYLTHTYEGMKSAFKR